MGPEPSCIDCNRRRKQKIVNTADDVPPLPELQAQAMFDRTLSVENLGKATAFPLMNEATRVRATGLTDADTDGPAVARQTPLPSFHEVLRPFVIDALGDALTTAQLSNAVLAAQPVQDDPDLLFRGILFAGRSLDVFNELLARAFACSSCLSYLPLLSGYDEPETFSYQIRLFGPISADVRQICLCDEPKTSPVAYSAYLRISKDRYLFH